MKKSFLITNLIIFLAILVGDICYLQSGELLIKGLTSACFVLLGSINLIYALKNGTNKRFCIVMLIGLFFGMLGDIFLNINFISGAILFAIGHIIYFIAYCCLEKFHYMDLISGVAIFVPSLLFIVCAPIFDFDGNIMKILCIVYALFISCMVGKSAVNFLKNKSKLNLILFIGSILFFFSDLMLLLDVFANVLGIAPILCLMSYYPAQSLLAFSLLFVEREFRS